MKLFFIILIFFMSLKASEDEFELQSFSFMMENDSPVDTDFSYTHGGRLALLFSTPYKFFEAKNSFLSIAYSNQMYTPAQLDKIYHVKNDRPYAGYSFVELGLHQTDTNSLNSFSIELGMVGPSTDMDILQKTIHNLIGTKKVCGWDYQLKDEYIFQLNYQRKDRFRLDDYRGYENDLVSYYGVQLGNKMTKLSGGALYRIGQNITDDFGVSSMNEANHSSVPIKPNPKSKKGTSKYINLALGANLIAKDIFLDGDTKTGSHYVDKNIFTAYIMAGFTYRYEEYKLDFFHSYYSEDYDQRDSYRTYRGYSSLVLTYAF